ncbi:Uncharacterized protein TCM_012013 [Theobroma cacao]|uniref:Uncharacterized protein n=1 Tax=Theobroma cacao TaxID=3641 RepID=A0A061G0X4_THECC|nr:Uncharacterized protein TCM_012013 [Theobroma cacao]
MGVNACLAMCSCCLNGRKKLQLGVNSRRHRRQWGSGSVKTKVLKLQRVVPRSHGLHLDQLLVHTADYISQLRLQVSVLEDLVKFHEP